MKAKNNQRNKVQSENRLKAIWRSSITAIIIASLGILTIYIFSTAYHNAGKIIIEPNETSYFGLHFMNGPKGELIQEGIAHFKRDIYNKGTINCGQCKSGATYFASPQQRSQFIKGPQLVKFYDVILDNSENLCLKGELQIVNSFRFKDGHVVVGKDNHAYYLHFLDNAITIDASHSKHIIGKVAKTGYEDFIFPIGNGRRLKNMGISDLDNETTVKVSYASFYQNGIRNLENHEVSIKTKPLSKHLLSICSEGYWSVESETPMKLSFFWDISFGLSTRLDSIEQLSLGGWNGKEWTNLEIDYRVGDLKAGVLVSEKLVPSAYSAYALAVTKRVKKKLKKNKVDNQTTKISDQDSLKMEKFVISPNPTNDIVSIFVEWPSVNNIDLFIRNDHKIQFYQTRLDGYGNLTYDVSDWPKGFYSVLLKTDDDLLDSQILMIQ